MRNSRKKLETGVALALDIAGSRSTVALVDYSGAIRYKDYAKTLWGRPAMASLEPYLRAIEQALAHARDKGWLVHGLGISIPGSVDALARRPLAIPILPSLNRFPLCDLLEARYHLPAHLHVDVDAALLAEYHFGAGKGFRRLLYLTFNAVVGAALIVDGAIERSPQGYVGHVSHVPIAASGPRCSCGKRGCINTLISLDAMQRMVQRALRRGEETSLSQRLGNHESFSPQLLAEEAMRGDAVALQVYEEVARWLGAAAARYISIFEPNALILGGGVISASEALFASMQRGLSLHPANPTNSPVHVVLNRLGNDAALIGAAVPCFQQEALNMSSSLRAKSS